MTLKTFQHTRVRPGLNSVKVNNNFQRKKISVKNLPRGSNIHVASSFTKPEKLQTKMSKIKASSQFTAGKAKARTKLQSMRVKRNKKVTVNIS